MRKTTPAYLVASILIASTSQAAEWMPHSGTINAPPTESHGASIVTSTFEEEDHWITIQCQGNRPDQIMIVIEDAKQNLADRPSEPLPDQTFRMQLDRGTDRHELTYEAVSMGGGHDWLNSVPASRHLIQKIFTAERIHFRSEGAKIDVSYPLTPSPESVELMFGRCVFSD